MTNVWKRKTKTTKAAIRPTRYPQLGYAHTQRGLWRFVDNRTGYIVGPCHRRKAELLADLDRFAAEFGLEASDARDGYKSNAAYFDGIKEVAAAETREQVAMAIRAAGLKSASGYLRTEKQAECARVIEEYENYARNIECAPNWTTVRRLLRQWGFVSRYVK